MNAIGAFLVLPFRIVALHPWLSIIGSALIALACYFLNYGSGMAFFVCMSCGILMWHDETTWQNAAAPAEGT